MNTQKATRFAPVAVTALIATTGLLVAGPLNPPAGPITSTGKTTQEIFDKVGSSEPRIAISAATTPGDANSIYRIALPGSYYLTGNITGVVGKHGIEVAANDVTIDLNGFVLAGVAGMGAFDGITSSVASLRGTHISNGTIRDWGGEGIDLFTFSSNDSSVKNVAVRQNASHGIYMDDSCVIQDCNVDLNGGNGIFPDSGAIVERCTSSNNTLHGISIGGGTVRRCRVGSNDSSGIRSANFSTIEECESSNNGVDGIIAGNMSVVRGNICSGNGVVSATGAGIHVTGVGNHIEDNRCITADRGILVDAAANTIIKNVCIANTVDWIIAVNNIYGPIVDRRAAATAFVNGFSAASTMGSTDTNANYSVQ